MSSLTLRVKSRATLTFSPDLETQLRHRCRNPKCRCKLPVPTDNLRNAFCCRSCFTGYFRSRCLVCEQPMERKREDQTTCGQSKCKSALGRDRAHFYGKWSQTPQALQLGVGNPIESGIKTAHKTDRPWRLVAGPAMGSATLRLVTVGAEQVRPEREQRAAVEVHLHDPEPARAAQREVAYVATVKRFRDRGYGRPVAAPAVMSSAGCSWEPCKHPANDFPDIPEFLQRNTESSS
jgi:hypothetical protein